MHEKPFEKLNGSGKHANWSLNYIEKDGSIKNLFSVPKKGEENKIFKLFILLNLMAVHRNVKLYLNSIASTGN